MKRFLDCNASDFEKMTKIKRHILQKCRMCRFALHDKKWKCRKVQCEFGKTAIKRPFDIGKKSIRKQKRENC